MVLRITIFLLATLTVVYFVIVNMNGGEKKIIYIVPNSFKGGEIVITESALIEDVKKNNDTFIVNISKDGKAQTKNIDNLTGTYVLSAQYKSGEAIEVCNDINSMRKSPKIFFFGGSISSDRVKYDFIGTVENYLKWLD